MFTTGFMTVQYQALQSTLVSAHLKESHPYSKCLQQFTCFQVSSYCTRVLHVLQNNLQKRMWKNISSVATLTFSGPGHRPNPMVLIGNCKNGDIKAIWGVASPFKCTPIHIYRWRNQQIVNIVTESTCLLRWLTSRLSGNVTELF